MTIPLMCLILDENGVGFQTVSVVESHDHSDETGEIEAHVRLKHRKDIDRVLQLLRQVEVGDKVLQAEIATLEAVDLLDGTENLEREFEERGERSTTTDSFEQVRAIFAAPAKPAVPESEEPVDEAAPGEPAEPAEGGDDADEEDIECTHFAQMGLSDVIMNNLSNRNFSIATPIQTLAIPPAMEGCDLIGRARTGTGKTLAFAIPMAERFLRNPGTGLRGLVVAPTRELAIQIKEVYDMLLADTGLKAVVIYGGATVVEQMVKIKEGVNILIATPGRLLDIHNRRRVRIDAVEMFVLDEADRMLDMGFLPDIETIFRLFYQHPQTLLFSATITDKLQQITGLNLESPVYVDTGGENLSPLETVSQKVLYVSPDEKEEVLHYLLDRETGPIIIFCSTKRSVERLSQRLKRKGYPATRIHGDISQEDRLKAVAAFRSGDRRILVATDVAARGLDIAGVAHVVNYELPMEPEDHLHRIGRTARAGATGKATTFITHREHKALKRFKQVLGGAGAAHE